MNGQMIFSFLTLEQLTIGKQYRKYKNRERVTKTCLVFPVESGIKQVFVIGCVEYIDLACDYIKKFLIFLIDIYWKNYTL